MIRALANAASSAFALGWEMRRRAYARGWFVPRRVPARVVSIGNLTTGGTGKTTLTLHLARARAAVEPVVVCRRYRPGPSGRGDEERMYAAALGEARVLAGRSKAELAATAAARGAALILIDDGFSHWPLLRDVDVVLIDATDPWGGRRMLPAGRLREPLRALQRAEAVVVTRREPGHDWRSLAEEIRRYAPAARLAAGRHRLTGVRGLDGSAPRREGAAVVVTATGNPGAVVKTAAESGYAPVRLAAYRDHHWFTDAQVAAERARAQAAGETLLITDKDAVRWPVAAQAGVGVLAVEWQWIEGGDAVESLVFGEEGA